MRRLCDHLCYVCEATEQKRPAVMVQIVTRKRRKWVAISVPETHFAFSKGEQNLITCCSGVYAGVLERKSAYVNIRCPVHSTWACHSRCRETVVFCCVVRRPGVLP